METGGLLDNCNRNMINILLALMHSRRRRSTNKRIVRKIFHEKFHVLRMGVPSGDVEFIHLREILSEFGDLIDCLTLWDYDEDGCSGDEALGVFGEFCEKTLKKLVIRNLFIENFVDIPWTFPLIECIELIEIDVYRIFSQNHLSLPSQLKELKIINCSLKKQPSSGDEKYAYFFEKQFLDFLKLNNRIELLSIRNSPQFGIWIFEHVKQLENLKSFEYTNTIRYDTFANGLIPLCTIETLKVLTLNCNDIDVYDLLTRMCSNGVNLESINLQNVQVNRKTMKLFKNMTQLNELVFHNMRLSDGLCINKFVKMLPSYIQKLSIKSKLLWRSYRLMRLLFATDFLMRMTNLQELKICCSNRFKVDNVLCDIISNTIKSRPNKTFLKITIYNKNNEGQNLFVNAHKYALFEIVVEPIENFV